MINKNSRIAYQANSYPDPPTRDELVRATNINEEKIMVSLVNVDYRNLGCGTVNAVEKLPDSLYLPYSLTLSD